MSLRNEQRCVSLLKDEHRFVFWYRPGQEDTIVDAFADLADAGDTPFDWFDAAILSYEVGRDRAWTSSTVDA